MRTVDEKIHCINTNRPDGGVYIPEKSRLPLKMNLYISGVNTSG